MNITLIARTLLASPSLSNPRVIHEKLGRENYSEALRLGWLVPEHETGAVSISPRLDHRRAMQEAAAPSEDEKRQTLTEGQAVQPESANRNFYGEATVVTNLVVTEALEPANDPEKPAEIGDQVTVADNGQTYQARVQAKNNDGTLKLSFGNIKPSRDTFKANELRVVSRTQATSSNSTVPNK